MPENQTEYEAKFQKSSHFPLLAFITKTKEPAMGTELQPQSERITLKLKTPRQSNN